MTDRTRKELGSVWSPRDKKTLLLVSISESEGNTKTFTDLSISVFNKETKQFTGNIQVSAWFGKMLAENILKALANAGITEFAVEDASQRHHAA